MLSILSQMTGCFTFLSYAVLIFQRSETSIDSYVSSIILAVMQLIGTMMTGLLADKFGRKLLMVSSLLGCAIGLAVLSVYLYLVQCGYELKAFALLPVICLSFVIFIGSAGVVGLLSVCTVENLPSKVYKNFRRRFWHKNCI